MIENQLYHQFSANISLYPPYGYVALKGIMGFSSLFKPYHSIEYTAPSEERKAR